MSRQDPGAAEGRGVYPPIRRCTCGESESMHAPRPDGTSGACTQSGCRRFEPSGEVLAVVHEVRWVPAEESS